MQREFGSSSVLCDVLSARTIGVTRHKDKMPEVKWTGLFGLGGESQKYGFEDEVSNFLGTGVPR